MKAESKMQFVPTGVTVRRAGLCKSLCRIVVVKISKGEKLLDSVVLNLWVTTPLRIVYQISGISDIYITIHNSSRIIN